MTSISIEDLIEWIIFVPVFFITSSKMLEGDCVTTNKAIPNFLTSAINFFIRECFEPLGKML